MAGDELPRTSLFRELRDRKVVRATFLYAVVGWGAIEVAETTLPLLGLGTEGARVVLLLVLAGFPLVVAGAWFFDLVPDRHGSETAGSGPDPSGSRPLLATLAGGAFLTVGGLVLASLAVVTLASPGSLQRVYWEGRVDSTRYVVLPVWGGDTEEAGGEMVDGRVLEWELTEELRRWSGLRVVDRFQVVDALRRHDVRDGEHPSTETSIALARDLGAGRLVRAEVFQSGEALSVVATVVDAAGGEPIATASRRMAGSLDEVREGVRGLVGHLIGISRDARDPAPGTTHSLVAAQAYLSGRRALEDGDASEAIRHFQAAVEADREYPEANLWLARVLSWSGDPRRSWGEPARRGQGDGPLLALAERRFPEACAGFRRRLEENPDDVPAWVGLGECQASDDAVVRDPDSPTGFRFRASWHSAAAAYREAMRRAPFLTPILHPRLRRVLPKGESATLRPGLSLEPPRGTYRAYPDLRGDTVAWMPFPLEEMESRPLPRGLAAAVAHGRRELEAAAVAWASTYPADSRAWLGLAEVLEEQGRLDAREGTSSDGATSAVERSRSTARVPEERVAASLAAVRLFLKTGRFENAAALADSILAMADPPPRRLSEEVAALAALRGRVDRAADLLTLSASQFRDRPSLLDLPSPLLETRARFRAYLASGSEPDSVRVQEGRIREMVRGAVPPSETVGILQVLLDDVIAFAPASSAHPPHTRPDAPNGLLVLRWHLSRGDTTTVRETLDRWSELRSRLPPGQLAPRQALAEARFRLLLGDTVQARDDLRRLLSALSSLTPFPFGRVEDTFALTRSMRLLARLEESHGDPASAQRWTERVGILTGPDLPARPTGADR